VRWWHWLLIAGATFGAGLLVGGYAIAGGTSAALAALAASMMRGRARRGLEFADDLRDRNDAEAARAEADDLAIREAGDAAMSDVLSSPGMPLAPPRSRHLDREP
jgi:hypothetical protein